MAQILSSFGIDWRLLAIDTVNFGIVLFVLWYFLYKPLLSMLEKRRQIVAQGVVDAEVAKERLNQIEGARMDMLAKAGKEADEVLARSRSAALERERRAQAESEAAAARIVAEAELQAREAKEQALAESKQEIAKLIVLGIEKAIVEKA